MSQIKKEKWHRVVWIPVFIWLLTAAIPAWAAEGGTWRNLKTKHALVRYQSIEDMETLTEKLKFGPKAGWSLRKTFFGRKDEEIIRITRSKVDAIYRRVQDLLGMTRRLRPVTIHLYPNKARMRQAYEEIYENPCEVRAWYIFKQNTIYISVEDIHEGMLAHEMAHAIVDHYMMQKPPAATAEILARFVDLHLSDEKVMPLNHHRELAAYPSD